MPFKTFALLPGEISLDIAINHFVFDHHQFGEQLIVGQQAFFKAGEFLLGQLPQQVANDQFPVIRFMYHAYATPSTHVHVGKRAKKFHATASSTTRRITSLSSDSRMRKILSLSAFGVIPRRPAISFRYLILIG